MDERGNVFQPLTIQRRRILERSLDPIDNGDTSARVEDLHIDDIARIAHAHPMLARISPLEPRTCNYSDLAIFLSWAHQGPQGEWGCRPFPN